jgi:superfamily II DNA or RNA helicase
MGDRFPTGLINIVYQTLHSNDITDLMTVKEYDGAGMDASIISADMFQGVTMRDYQLQAAKMAISYTRGILKMATNSGKTLVIAAIVKAMLEAEPPGSALILTTKKDLLYQLAERLENRLQEPVGIVGDGEWYPKRVTVGMIQTLCRHTGRMRTEFNGNLTGVIYDECHHIPSKTSQEVMMSLDAPVRLGFSGTPLKNDDLNDLVLIGATGSVLMEVTNDDLVRAGISAEPLVRMYAVDEPEEYWDDTWREAYDACIVDNEYRNELITDVVVGEDAASTLILVERVDHGRDLALKIENADFVHGGVDMYRRRKALEALRAGIGAVVVATPIFDEGVDVPAVDLLVMACGGKGHQRLLQRIGRGMRQKDGDNTLLVIDFIDDTNKYLLNHSYIRAGIYEDEGFDVELEE